MALIIFPEGHSIPRRLLTPAKVPLAGSALPTTARLVSHMRHGNDCAYDTLTATYLDFDDVSSTTDGVGAPLLNFDFDQGGSQTCIGDSGSPYVSGGFLVSVHSASNGDSAKGPWLSGLGGVREWLEDNGINRDGDEKEAWEDNCDARANSNQSDLDGDGIGDACDPCQIDPQHLDEDEDEYLNCGGTDPCPSVSGRNERQCNRRAGRCVRRPR